MQFKNILFFLASALAVSAAPAEEMMLDKRGGWTCGDAYNQCMGKGKGMYVCYADNKSHKCGQWNGWQMKQHWNEPLQNYCPGQAYCCNNEVFLELQVDVQVDVQEENEYKWGQDQTDIQVDVDVDIEVWLQEHCSGWQMTNYD